MVESHVCHGEIVKTASRAARRVRGLVRETYQWCDNPRMDRRDVATRDIFKALKGKGPSATHSIAIDLNGLSAWYGEHGARAVFEGDVEGWANIDRSFNYLSVSARITSKLLQASFAASVVANAVVFGEDMTASALAARLIHSLEDRAIFPIWEYGSFGALMVKLWGLYQGLEVNIARSNLAPLGVYQSILAGWHDDAALSRALSDACDYHLEQTLDRSPYPEFVWPPYMLFPVDILVVGEIRRRLGLTTPQVDHPLLNTPLAKVPPPEQRPRMGPDPLLDEVMARARQDGLIT